MEEQYFMWYCPICAKNKDDLDAKYHVHGYIDESTFIIRDNKCLMGHEAIKLTMPCNDYNILTHISIEPKFIDSMVKLHDNNIIEYNLKMSQFKTQLEQQKSIKTQNDAIPKCPHCGSADIKSISGLNRGVSIAMWGVFSKKINKSFECKNCGYTW